MSLLYQSAADVTFVCSSALTTQPLHPLCVSAVPVTIQEEDSDDCRSLECQHSSVELATRAAEARRQDGAVGTKRRQQQREQQQQRALLCVDKPRPEASSHSSYRDNREPPTERDGANRAQAAGSGVSPSGVVLAAKFCAC